MACLDQQHSGKEGQAIVVVEDLPISDLNDFSNLDCICCLKDHNNSAVVVVVVVVVVVIMCIMQSIISGS